MKESTGTKDLASAALLAALTAVGAYIAIPMFGVVPFTLQVLFVLLSGLVLGARLGVLSMLAYVALGLVAPVYAGGTSGVGVLFGPPGGYIWGFVVAAFVVGTIMERLKPRRLVGLTLAGLTGLVPIYVLGATWLALQIDLSFEVAFWVGVVQFLPADVAKAIIAGALMRALCATPVSLPSLRTDVHPAGRRPSRRPQVGVAMKGAEVEK